MKYLKNKRLINIFLILINILIFIYIIKEFKILNFCYTLITLISPIFFGYAVAWLIKPVMLFFNKYFKEWVSVVISYILIVGIVGLICYFTIPIIIHEIKNLIPVIVKTYKNLDPLILENIDLNIIGTKVLAVMNDYTIHIKDILLNIFYSVFISYYFLINHKSISNFFAKKVPHKLIYELSINLKSFVRGTIIDTIILFILCIVSFYFANLPYAFLFAVIISLTNIIPFIGPYIGGIPSALVAFSVSSKLGIVVLLIVIILQVIESSFVHPYIMSKSLKVNPILILISVIVFGYFFGIIGMLISTPVLSVIKTLYEYNKEHQIINWPILDK